MILLAGAAVLSFKLTISDHWARFFEACAGIMLIGLGFSVGLSLLREHLHGHSHRNEGEQASHFHLHAHHDGLSHSHNHRHGLELKSLAIGIVHGLAGSAVVSLAAVSGSHSVAEGILYLLLFGLGSIGGMVLLGGLMTLPLTLTSHKWAPLQVAVKLFAGLASIIVGSNILFSIA
jgi:sulfite exporter TauE/SafE